MKVNRIVLLAGVVGIILFFVAAIYFLEPAQSLPHFFPGYAPQLARHHFTHGVASLFLGLVAFAIAWFKSGEKSSK